MVSTRHGEAADAKEADAGHAPSTRTRQHADGGQAGQEVERPRRHSQQQQQRPQRHAAGSDSDDEGSEEGTSDAKDGDSEFEDGALNAAAAAAAGDEAGAPSGGRSARAGRSLRDTVKKPPPSHVIQTFTRQRTPPRQPSRAERRQQEREQQREQGRLQRQQEAQLQELEHQQRELQVALRAAAGGSHLTRHQTRLLKVWAENAADLDAATIDAAALGDADAAALLAAAATEALIKSEPESGDGDDEGEEEEEEEEGEEPGSSDGEEAAAAGRRGTRRGGQQQAAAAAAAGASGGAARGLKGELLRLKQAAAEAKAAERRRRQREAIRQANKQQRILRDLGDSRRNSFDDVLLEYSSEEDLGEETSSQGVSDEGGGGRRLRKRRRATWSEEGSEGEDADGEEDYGSGKKKYKLRSRDRTHPEAQPARHVTATRPRARAPDPRHHVKHVRHERRRGGFSELSSDDPDTNLFMGGPWSRLLAAGAVPTGPFYAPGGLPPTPAAAAVAAAATAAAGGLLSPRGTLDRRSSTFLDAAAPGTANRAAAGSGWGQWAPSGELGGSGGGGGPAAAAAGGTAADKRGAGLGQELITPLQVDPSIDFDQIGGLDQYLSALKEMVFLPLLYPEIFDKFGVNPPRGVLFHGPPGTGKTLVARALAAQASRAAGQKVSFYMRKGADLLSKWVGEAEKQLRLLFEEASKHQPAIIFFDEIDGLAPVRTSKQDQVHNSIVSTLLALMDGLESRGRVVLIGATNRPDALDPALRRPGRFDRELLFPMPDLTARRSILAIHSRHWQPPPPPELLDDLAQRTGGYCGADLRALCAEASLAALRRVYPQIYTSDVKLLIDPSAVRVTRADFTAAMKDLTPAAHRATASHAKALNPVIEPCLAQPLKSALAQIQQLFPPAAACMAAAAAAAAGSSAGSSRGLAKLGGSNGSGGVGAGGILHMARPRVLLAGEPGTGQQQLGAAVLAALEGLPVHCIGLTSLLANVAARCVEEALVSAFTEARRSAPAVIYWPQAHLWWAAAGSGLRCALVALLDDLPPDLPLMLLATAELPPVDPSRGGRGTAGALLGGSSSRRLLTAGPTAAAAAAAGGSAGRGGGPSSSSSAKQQELLEELGMDPTLAALFPPLGQLSDVQGLQEHASTAAVQDGQRQGPAGPGCDVLGWVLLDKPGPAERRQMFQGVFEAAAAPPAPEEDTAGQQAPSQLPPAPDAAAAAEAQQRAAAAAAARVAYEEDQAVLRSLRMILRGIVQRTLTLKRYRLFAEPPMLDDKEGMRVLQCLTCPMDLLTMLYKVDHQQYVTPAAFLADAHLIVKCAEELYGQTEEATIAAPGPSLAAAAAAAAAARGAAAAAPPQPTAPAATAGDAAGAASTAAAAGGGGSGQGGELFTSPDGLGAGSSAAGASAGAAAAAAAGAASAAAAAGGVDDSGPVVAPLLPALRVSVSKEISRAMELKDGLEQQVYQLVPPELVQACEAIAAKGGPAPPPPGMLLPQQLLSVRLPASTTARPAATGDANKPTRTTARLTGQKLDKKLLHADPEALMRARKQSKAKAAAPKQAAEAGPGDAADAAAAAAAAAGEQQEQDPEQQQAAAGGDVEMLDAADAAAEQAVPAADASAAAAGDAGAAADAESAQQQQGQLLQQEPPAALKPVTNAPSRKRRASSAEDAAAAECGGVTRPAKAPRQLGTTEHQQQNQQQDQQQQGQGDAVAGPGQLPADKHQPQQQQNQQQPWAASLGGQQQDGQQQQDQAQASRQPELLAHREVQGQQHAAGGDEPVPAVQAVSPTPAKAPAEADMQLAEQLLQRVVAASADMQLSQLELLHARLSRVVAAHCRQQDRTAVLQQLGRVIEGLRGGVEC